jgi:hypothetical protein
MITKKMSLCLLFFGIFYATIACGDSYRCVNPQGFFEFTNRPCAADGSLSSAPAIPSAPAPVISTAPVPEIPSAPASQRSDGALCPFTLSSQPQSSGNPDSRAQLLDDLEARLYRDARLKQISWVQLVDKFYTRCAALYQGYYNENYRELPAYQRVLAEKMDARSIKESEWIYLIETKLTEIKALDHEIRTRNQLIENTRPSPIIIQNPTPIHRSTNCTTREYGGTYHTSCY